jgi:hypothetical protein
MGRKKKYHPNNLSHGYANAEGAREVGRPFYSPGERDGEGQPDEQDSLLDQIERLLPPEVREPLLAIHVDGMSQADFARLCGIHPGTAGRRLRRLGEQAKPALLAILAALTLRKGIGCFCLSARTGAVVHGDQWAVPDPELTALYDHVPSAEEIHAFSVSRWKALLAEGAHLGVRAGRPVSWLDVSRLYRDETAAAAAARRQGQPSICHLQSGRIVWLSPPDSRAA